MKDLSIGVSFIEDSPGLEEPSKPLIRNFAQKLDLRMNARQVSIHKILLAQNEVETDSGWVKRNQESVSGLISEAFNFNSASKGLTDTWRILLTDDQGSRFITDEPRYNLVIQFELLNKKYQVSRVYSGVLDFFGNVGGSCELILFLFVFILTFHSSLVLELYLLNQTALQLPAGHQK